MELPTWDATGSNLNGELWELGKVRQAQSLCSAAGLGTNEHRANRGQISWGVGNGLVPSIIADVPLRPTALYWIAL